MLSPPVERLRVSSPFLDILPFLVPDDFFNVSRVWRRGWIALGAVGFLKDDGFGAGTVEGDGADVGAVDERHALRGYGFGGAFGVRDVVDGRAPGVEE